MSAKCKHCSRDLDYDLNCVACDVQALLSKEQEISAIMKKVLELIASSSNLIDLGLNPKYADEVLTSVKELREKK